MIQRSINIIAHQFLQQLSISLGEVEDILIALILDGRVRGQIDQVSGKVELNQK